MAFAARSTSHHWVDRDLRVLWHPCTQMKDHEWLPLLPIERGEGVWLYDYEGKRYLDAISSWWVTLLGHNHPVIRETIKGQLDKLEQVIFAGFTHEPAILLAEALTQSAPTGLTRCFYTDNGSSAVEVALKMSYHFWRNTGFPQKNKFITLANSYHGETLGALAVGDVALYKKTYEPLLMGVLTAPSPDSYLAEAGETPDDTAGRALQAMRVLLEREAERTCAVIVEPLVQCAGGMRMYSASFLSGLRKLCDEFQVHLIADEIAVGMGRTGTLWACEQARISPDFMCVGKGLTGGFLPLAAVLTRESIYQAFYDDFATQKAFLHSHSYTANPLACSAAVATLSLLQQEKIIESNKTLALAMARASTGFLDHPNVSDVRQKGMIVAIEMVQDKYTKTPWPWQERRGLRAYQKALELGVVLRPLGNVLYWMPPYCITEEEITHLAEVTWQALEYAVHDA